MSCKPGAHSVILDPTGESALVYLPARGEGVGELRFHAAHAAHVDATFAVALRACLEHFHGYVGMPVRMVEAPADDAVRRELSALLGPDVPDAFGLNEEGPAPSTVILPASRIAGYAHADRLGAAIVDPLGRHYDASTMRFVAAAFALLVENGLLHARDSSVDVLAAISYDRRADEVRLAVVDTGESMSRLEGPSSGLRNALDRSEADDGGLHDLVALPKRWGLEATITLATGNARAYGADGGWTIATAEAIDGFAAIVSVKAH